MTVCRDCHMAPVRVGDAVRFRYDRMVGFGEWEDGYMDCIVEGCPKGGVPILSVIGSGFILQKVYDPEMDLEKIELTEEQKKILNADMEMEMERLQPELYEV